MSVQDSRQLYFHVGDQIVRSKETEALFRVLDALSLRSMAVIYQDEHPYDVLFEEFGALSFKRTKGTLFIVLTSFVQLE